MGSEAEQTGAVNRIVSARDLDPNAPLTREQMDAIERAKAMKLMPFKPRLMPGEIALRLAARISWLLAAATIAYTVLRPPGWFVMPGFVMSACLLIGVILWLLAPPLGRAQARRLVLPHNGLVCPACHYPLESIGNRGLCPECATVFDPVAVLECWRWGYRLREIQIPGAEDIETLMARLSSRGEGKDKSGRSAKDGAHDEPPAT